MACNIKEVMVEIQSLINEQAVKVMSKTIIDKKDLVEISNLKKQVDILQKKKQTYEKYERERKSVKGKEDARRKVDKIAEEIKEVEELIDVLSTDSPKAKEKIVKSLLRKIDTVEAFKDKWSRLTGTKKKPMSKREINIFYGSDENKVLSNLASRPFTFKGKRFKSVEHAYQSLKSGTGLDEKVYENPDWNKDGAIIRGTKGTKTENNWNINVLMKTLIRESFEQNPAARQKLLDTGTSILTHVQGDKVWAKEFPRLLMEYRDNIKGGNDKRSSTATLKVINNLKYNSKLEDNQINTMRQYGGNKDKHYGNPFGVTNYENKATIPNAGTAEEVSQRYLGWLRGENDSDVEPKRRAWILEQIDAGKLDGKELVYYKNTPINHAKKLLEFINEKRNKSSKKYSAGEIIEQELSIDEIVEIEKRNEEYLVSNPDVIVVNGNRFMWEDGVITVDATASRADRAVYLAHEIVHDKTVNWLERNSNDKDVVRFSRLMKMVKNKLENMSIAELGKPDNMLLRERLLYTGIGTNQELGENVAVMLAEPEVQRALERMLGNDNRNLIQRVLDRVKEFLWPTKEEKVYADKVMKAVKNIERKAVEEKASVKDKAGIIRDIGNAKAANEIFNEIGKCI